MAEILIAARDLPSGYQRGDPITVQPDGHVWGKAEGPPDFYVLKVHDLDLRRARDMVAPLFEPAQSGDPEFNAPDPADRRIYRHRRKTRLVIEDLDPTDRTVLERDGEKTISLKRIRGSTRRLAYDRTRDELEVTDEQEFPRSR